MNQVGARSKFTDLSVPGGPCSPSEPNIHAGVIVEWNGPDSPSPSATAAARATARRHARSAPTRGASSAPE
jgi:hypothetical protein